MAWLRDPVWQAVGAISAVVVAAVIYLLQRRRKALAYRVVADIPLLSAAADVLQEMQVLFRGQAVRRPRLVVVELRNTGNEAIWPEDYWEAVSFGFGPDVKVLTAAQSRAEPATVSAAVDVQNGRVVLGRLGLNPGDVLGLRVLLDGENATVSVDGSIAGLKRIAEGGPMRVPLFGWHSVNVFMICVAVLDLAAGIALRDVILLLIGAIVMAFGFLFDSAFSRARKRR